MSIEDRVAELRRLGYGQADQQKAADGSSAFRRIPDLGIDVARSAINFGEAAVGLGNLATAGALQRGIKDYYRPEEAEQFLAQYYGAERQAEEKKIQESQGFTGRLGALASEPGALIGRAVQSLPSMLPAAKGMQVAKALGYGRTGISAAGAIGEGLTTAAQQGQEVIGRDPENVGGMYAQLPAGAITGAIAFGAGHLGGNVESVLAGRGMTLPGTTSVRAGRGALAEAGEETLQSMNEQVFMNLAEGRPWNENVLEAGAEGMLIGGLTGGVFGALSPQEAEVALKQDEETQPPAAPPVAPAPPVVPPVVDEVLPTAADVLAPEPVPPAEQPTQPSDLIQGEPPQTARLREIAAQTQARMALKDNIRTLYTEEAAAVRGSEAPKGVITAAVNRLTKDKNTVEEVVAVIDEQLAKTVTPKNAETQDILARMRARLVPAETVAVAPEEQLAADFSVENLQRIADRIKREEVIPSATQEVIEQAGVPAEPQGGVSGGQAAEAGISDSVLRAEEGQAEEVAPVTPETVLARVGTTPKNSQPVTVRDGVIYVGDEPAVDYESGEDVRAEGTTVEELGRKLRAAGAITGKQRVYAPTLLPPATKEFKREKAAPQEIDEARTARPSGQSIGTVLQRLKGEFGIDGISRLISKGILNVVQSVDNLPLHLQESIGPNTPAFYNNGKVYMIADRLKPEGIRGAFLHELGEHYGLEDMLGMRRYREVLGSIIKLAKTDGDIAAALEYVRKNYKEYKDGSQKQAREVIAHLGETAPNHNLWQRIVQAVKTWLIKQGFTKANKLTAEDLQGFVIQSARRGLKGQVRRYSQSRLFSAEAPEGVEEQRVGDFIEVDGVQRPTTNSNGKPIAPTEEALRNFWRWFGDSKVVDDQGRPLVVYRGMSQPRVEGYGDGTEFWTSDPAAASEYAVPLYRMEGDTSERAPNVEAAYISMKNPYVMRTDEQATKLARMQGFRIDPAMGYWEAITPKTREVLESKGYDGIIFDDGTGGMEHDAYFVFHPTQIKSAIGNRGTYSPESANIDEARWEATLPQQVGDTISAVKARVPTQDLWARVKKFGLKAMMLHQIDELYGDKLSVTKDGKVRRPIKEFTSALLRMGRARDEIQRQAASIIQHSANLPAQSKARLDVARPTLSQLGIKSKDIVKDGKVVDVEVESWGDLAPEEAKKIWQGLTLKERLAYADTRSGGQRLYKGLLNAIRDQLNSMGPAGQSVANDFISTAGTLKGDFFPLDREGENVVVWMSNQYLEAKAQDNIAEMNRMKKMLDSPHYIVRRFEILDDAQRFQDELNAKGHLRGDTGEKVEGKALYYRQPEFVAGLDRIPQGFVQKLNEALDVNLSDIDARIQGAKNAGDKIQVEWLERQKELAEYNVEMKYLITQLYVQALPEYSAAKRHLHRSGITGYNKENSIRTFSAYAERVAGATAKARHMQQVLDALTLAGEAAREAGKAGDPTFQNVVDVLRQHQEAIINPRHRPGAWQAWLSNAAYIWYLGMTPAFALTNMSQGFLVSAPVIAGRLGMNQLKVQKALIQAMGDAFGVNKSWISEAEGNLFKRLYNAKPNYMEVPQVDENGAPTGLTELKLDLSGTKLSEEEQTLVRALYEQSAIDINQTNDVVTSAEGLSLMQSESMKVLSLFAHHSEVLNRIATGLAAYRLAKEKGGKSAKGVVITPEDFAADIIQDTHFNYMNVNAPLFLKPGFNPVATVMGQFRKYQVGMVGILARNMALAIRGAYRGVKGQGVTEEERIAIRTLNGLLMSHAVVAGSLGMPLVGTFAWAIAKILDDEDDPWDKERVVAEYRNWLAEVMGVDAAEVAAHGVFRTPVVKDVLPATLGERVGQQDILSPFRNLRASNRETARDTMLKTLGAAIAGPAGGMTGDLLTAWEMIGKGEFERGVEYATPKFIRDAFKTYRFAEEGVTTSRGETRIGPEAFEGMDLFWQSMGFPPSEVTELYRAQGAVQGYSEARAARRSNLISREANAWMAGDFKEAARIRDDLAKAYNEANPEYPILPKDFMAAHGSRVRTQQRINEQGIEENRRRPGEAELGRFANVE